MMATGNTDTGRDVGTDSDPIIAVRGLRNQFGDAIIHDDLDLDVRRGEILVAAHAVAPAGKEYVNATGAE